MGQIDRNDIIIFTFNRPFLLNPSYAGSRLRCKNKKACWVGQDPTPGSKTHKTSRSIQDFKKRKQMSPHQTALIIVLVSLTFIGLISVLMISISRRCFFCHKKNYEGPFLEDNSLTKIELPELSTHKYYHRICLRRILNDPEKYYGYVDNAVKIQERIYTNNAEAQRKIRRIQERFEQAQFDFGGATKITRPTETESKKDQQEHINRYSILKTENKQ
jgi:hypothetical protein